MRQFAIAHRFLQGVYHRPNKWGYQLIALLLCIPCFHLSDFFFKCAYLINHRRLVSIGRKSAALGGQNGALKLNDLSLNIRDRFKLKEALCNVRSELEAGNSAL